MSQGDDRKSRPALAVSSADERRAQTSSRKRPSVSPSSHSSNGSSATAARMASTPARHEASSFQRAMPTSRPLRVSRKVRASMKPGCPAPAAPKRCIEAIRSCSFPGFGVWIDMWISMLLLLSGASPGLAGLPLPTRLLDQFVELTQRVRFEPVGAIALAQVLGLLGGAFQQRRAAGSRPSVVLVLRDELRHDVVAQVHPT